MAEPGDERVDGRRVVTLIFAGWLPQDGLFGGSGTAGLATSVAPEGAAHSAVAGWLLTLPSPARCSSTDAARRGLWFSRSGRVAPGAGRGSTWSTRSAASMNDVDRRPGAGEPL